MIQTDIEDFLVIYKTIYPQKKFVYMSTPITTGPRFVEWYRRVGKDYTDKSMYDYQFERNVKRFNEIDAAAKAKNLASILNGALVVNPGEFKINLSQKEFKTFWDKFIAEHADYVVLSEGWALSRGCLYELQSAINNNVRCVDFNLFNLDSDKCIFEIEKAIQTLKGVDLDYSVQTETIRLLSHEHYSYLS